MQRPSKRRKGEAISRQLLKGRSSSDGQQQYAPAMAARGGPDESALFVLGRVSSAQWKASLLLSVPPHCPAYSSAALLSLPFQNNKRTPGRTESDRARCHRDVRLFILEEGGTTGSATLHVRSRGARGRATFGEEGATHSANRPPHLC